MTLVAEPPLPSPAARTAPETLRALDGEGLPTRAVESWRYADLEALARVWERLPAAEAVLVPAGETAHVVIDTLPVDDGVGIIRREISVGDNAIVNVHIVASGADYARIELGFVLGRSAHVELGGVILSAPGQTVEIVTRMRHAEPDATSNQTVRAVLAGRSTGSFLGRVEVARHAQKTDASQSFKAMLLDRAATANAKPELEIYADDVKCAHGATVGELDASALYYMAARGIPPARAKALLLHGFVADALEGVVDEAARAALMARASAALDGLLA